MSLTKQEVKDRLLELYGSNVLPGGFSADMVAQFYCNQLNKRGLDREALLDMENINTFLNKCQGW
jgi:phenylalanine-4-hydroxylase